MSIVNIIPRLKTLIQDIDGGNQTAFSKRLGLKTPVILNDFLHGKSGKTGPSIVIIIGLLNIGISIDWFLTGEGQMWRKSAEVMAVEALPAEKDADRASMQLQTAHSDKVFAQNQARNCQELLREERAERRELSKAKTRYQRIANGLRRRIEKLKAEGSGLAEDNPPLETEALPANRMD